MKKIKIANKRGRNPVMEEYTRSVKAGIHVVPSKDGWKVKSSRSSCASKVLSTQKEAIVYALKIAKKDRPELFIHGKDSCIRKRDSYGKDSFPPRE